MSIPHKEGASSPSTVSKDRPFDNRSDGNDCSLFKVVPRRSLTQIRFRFSHYEDLAPSCSWNYKEREKKRERISIPLLFKSPKKLKNPYPFSPPPSAPGERRIRVFPDNFESRSELWFPRGWAAGAIAAKRVFSLVVASVRRTGATIARRRDYPSFAGQRIFSSWAPPLRRGWGGWRRRHL